VTDDPTAMTRRTLFRWLGGGTLAALVGAGATTPATAGDPDAAVLDGEDEAAAEHVDEVRCVGRHVTAGHVQEVEPQERHRLVHRMMVVPSVEGARPNPVSRARRAGARADVRQNAQFPGSGSSFRAGGRFDAG